MLTQKALELIPELQKFKPSQGTSITSLFNLISHKAFFTKNPKEQLQLRKLMTKIVHFLEIYADEKARLEWIKDVLIKMLNDDALEIEIEFGPYDEAIDLISKIQDEIEKVDNFDELIEVLEIYDEDGLINVAKEIWNLENLYLEYF